jgi:hypothetical protein
MSCDSWDSNAPYDVVPAPQPGDALNPVNCYLGEHMERYLTHPYASPLFGDFAGLPPLLIQAGEAEVLRDEITLLAHKARRAGVAVRHEIYEDAVHVFQAFPFLDASTRAFESVREFVHGLPQPAAAPGLQDDIDNGRTVVVDGDGADAKEPLQADDRDDVRSWREEDSPWPSPPHSDDEGTPGPTQDLLFPHPTAPSGAPIVSASPAPMKEHDYLDAPRPRGRNHVRQRTATLSASSPEPAPRPRIRSSASHVDISALVSQWEAEPAPATTYRHEEPQPGKISRKGSSFFA